MNQYAVFGDPVFYSKSPDIYFLFVNQKMKQSSFHSYIRIKSSSDKFKYKLVNFFKNGGLGANITSPLKEYAYILCDKLTFKSTATKTVNTIKKLPDGSLLGDNTDGIGLLCDLKRLKFLQKNSTILLIGAGGAARGVIYQLLVNGHTVILTNRSFIKAKNLEFFFCKFGNIKALPMDKINNINFNLIINATTTSMNETIPDIPKSIIKSTIYCYDMFYQQKDTSFIAWCRENGAINCSDGLGMLVNQAAFSFLLWHGILPSVLPIIKIIRKQLSYNSI